MEVTSAELHAGPLPHPDSYERYATIIPDGANRIMRMAEKEQAHRHRMEPLGTISAFVLSLAFLLVGGFLVLRGHDGAGATIITLTVVGLAAVFITGKIPELLDRGGGSTQRD